MAENSPVRESVRMIILRQSAVPAPRQDLLLILFEADAT